MENEPNNQKVELRNIFVDIMSTPSASEVITSGVSWYNKDRSVNYDGISHALKAKIIKQVESLPFVDNFVGLYIGSIFSEFKGNNIQITPENLLEKAKNTNTWKTNLG